MPNSLRGNPKFISILDDLAYRGLTATGRPLCTSQMGLSAEAEKAFMLGWRGNKPFATMALYAHQIEAMKSLRQISQLYVDLEMPQWIAELAAEHSAVNDRIRDDILYGRGNKFTVTTVRPTFPMETKIALAVRNAFPKFVYVPPITRY